MTMVAGQAAITNPRHAIPILHRRISPLDAQAHARSRRIEPLLPIFQRLVALGPVGDLVVDAGLRSDIPSYRSIRFPCVFLRRHKVSADARAR